MKGTETSNFGTSGDWLLRRLGEPLFRRKRGGRCGRVKALDDLARAGLPVQGKVVLTEKAREPSLKVRGILEGVKVASWEEEDPRQKSSEIRSHYGSVSTEASLKQVICRALIRLGPPIVTVFSEGYEKRVLKTIPGVVDAVLLQQPFRSATPSPLRRAKPPEAVPTWPALIQRGISSIYTAWSIVEGMPIETPRVADLSRGKKVVPHDVEPFGVDNLEHMGITNLALEAGSASRTGPRILWGLEGGGWYVLWAEMEEDEKSGQGGFS